MYIDYQTAIYLGFPGAPREGQQVIDREGNIWGWQTPTENLGELGFWQLIAQGVSMAVGALAGGKKSSAQKDAEKKAAEAAKQAAVRKKQAEDAAWAAYKQGETAEQRSARKCAANPSNPRCAPGGALTAEGIAKKQQSSGISSFLPILLLGGAALILFSGK